LWPLADNIYERIQGILIPLSRKNKISQEKMINFYSQLIKKGDLCFDVGAHMGNRTEVFLKLGARVIAVEPQEKCFKYLENKFGKDPNFILIKKGLSDKEEELPLLVCEEANTISTFSDEWKTGRFSDYKWNKKEIVPCITLDNLIKEFGLPDFCKIDVEGLEYQVLKGLSKPIKYLSFEFTKEFFEKAKLCTNYILSLGPAQFNCDFSEKMKFIFPEWVTVEKLYEKLYEKINDNLSLEDYGDIYVKFCDN